MFKSGLTEKSQSEQYSLIGLTLIVWSKKKKKQQQLWNLQQSYEELFISLLATTRFLQHLLLCLSICWLTTDFSPL